MSDDTPSDVKAARERAISRRRKLADTYKPGDLIANRYEVQRVVGAGGMGVVYLVTDREAGNRLLALKTLLPQYVTNKYAVRRFIREVDTIRRCDHPGVIRIYDAQMDGSLLYYTMEYLEGMSLRKYMRQRGTLGLGSTVRLLSLVAHALEHAHQYTIHRDISPENIMVLPDGTIKLLDFGLAKLTDNEGGFTMIGTALGKMQYGAPEQRLNARDADLRADLYPLGVMFVEMLTGKLPNDGPPVTEVVPGLPTDLVDEFLAKTLAPRPNDRYMSAKEVRIALKAIYDAYEQGQAEPQRPRGAVSPARPGRFRWLNPLNWFRRKPAGA